jgi:hypothetical protein
MILTITFLVGSFVGFWAGFIIHALAVTAKQAEISEPLNLPETPPADFRNRPPPH